MRIAVDTSVVVAALLADHEAHARALPALQRALGSENVAVVPYPVLVEAYAVMTRLPPPLRVGPADAERLLRSTFARRALVAQVDAADVWEFIADRARSNVRGGATYDALIVACAVQAGAHELLTFNERHFLRVAPTELRVRVP